MLLIVASSGRMLAEAAHEAGLQAVVVDLFADSDTRRHAVEVRHAPSLALRCVAPMLDELKKRHRIARAVYGSGLECHPETLAYLHRHFRLLGNSPDVFLMLRRKAEFFAALGALDIPFPKVAFTPPAGESWLVKPMQGQGGVGIHRFDAGRPVGPDVYWQKYQSGVPGSVLFLADRRRASVVGFNRQFTINLGPGLEFAFSGLINHSTLSADQQAQVSGWARRCTRAFGLRGLNSLDFIHDGAHVYALEINPRPSASMQLYDGMLARHIEACGGVLPAASAQQGFSGLQIVYATGDARVAEDFVWPEGARDIPDGGAVCRGGQPLCTLFAQGDAPQCVLAALAGGRQHIFNQLYKVQCDGISSECE